MKIDTQSFSIETKGHTDIIDITGNVRKILSGSGLTEGSVLIFVPGSTAGITTIEFEPGLLHDYPAFFEKVIPSDKSYRHNETWHDGNGHAHVRASLQGGSFTVPFTGAKLLLGTWQQIVLIDFDARPRNRKVIVQLTGK
ncbi:MAG: secondary thiamine-phosphate synthase enzyme YjbQ [Melioribacteraceae bacterium]|nr:secondary thiamine-phosphate synthase enzyme YjbQ [Melioribacteraceae bacterium]WKZ70282.1 MAG: secondary thiamine-phosphate synthase enzyme YjbQ [Melioribacteraceae bacterium]